MTIISGDLDAGGFYIFRTLERKSEGIPFQMFSNGHLKYSEKYERVIQKPLTENDKSG